MSKILLVEDDLDLGLTIVDYLCTQHYTVESVSDGTEALDLLGTYVYDLVIMDWGLPGVTGIEICRQARSRGVKTPIIMLTGRSHISEKETGFESGVDDYLTKPFDMKELGMRVRAVLRRPAAVLPAELAVANITLNVDRFAVTVGGQPVKLLPKEFALLEYFMRHPDTVLSAESILDRVWSSDADVTPEAVVSCLRRLRKKVDTDPEKPIFQTVHGKGYKLVSG